VAPQQDDYYLWETVMWHYTEGLTLTAELCHDYAHLFDPDTAFVALRFPVQPPTLPYSAPYTLPVSFRNDASPHAVLLDERAFPVTSILTVPLEYKAQYLTFAENELPSAPGEHWLTLGAVSSPTIEIDCDSLPDLADSEWEVRTRVWLDFGGVQDTAMGHMLPLNYCYEGQELPSAMSQALGQAGISYQGWGITCVGPHYLTLLDWPDWELTDQSGAWITPTQSVTFTHRIYKSTFKPLSFTLEVSSTLDAGWVIYDGQVGQTPVPDPLRVDSGATHYFRVVGQAPVGTADGSYTLFVTARTDDTLPALRRVSDLMWVGNWVAPPGGTQSFSIYLPLVVKPGP
jgi:hypothetical protein